MQEGLHAGFFLTVTVSVEIHCGFNTLVAVTVYKMSVVDETATLPTLLIAALLKGVSVCALIPGAHLKVYAGGVYGHVTV
jgi:hypothetical protein